ncbi:MAG: hypothetical protein WA081_10030 [Desulfosalsimonadaceae bacterium]
MIAIGHFIFYFSWWARKVAKEPSPAPLISLPGCLSWGGFSNPPMIHYPSKRFMKKGHTLPAGGAHCDAAPGLTVCGSRGQTGSARIEVNKSAGDDKQDRQNQSRQSII